MKILVVSDSHGQVEPLLRAVERSNPNLVIHLGDGWRDAEELSGRFPDLPLEQVPGNCDFAYAREPAERILLLGGKRVMICHGHTLHVKYGLLNALYAAQERQADALLFGHTHEPLVDVQNGIVLLNPGCAGDYAHPTYGILDIRDGRCRADVYSLA